MPIMLVIFFIDNHDVQCSGHRWHEMDHRETFSVQAHFWCRKRLKVVSRCNFNG